MSCGLLGHLSCQVSEGFPKGSRGEPGGSRGGFRGSQHKYLAQSDLNNNIEDLSVSHG